MSVPGSNKGIAFFIFLFLLVVSRGQVQGQAYGLQFSSHEVVPEKRTALLLTNSEPVCFSNQLDLSFDIGFTEDRITYFGYIFRLINDKGQNIDLLYDQKSEQFRLVAGETFTDIYFQVNSDTLKQAWTRLDFSLDAGGNLSCRSRGRRWQSKSPSLKSRCFKLVFGSCDEPNFVSRDLPPMRLRDVEIKLDGKLHNVWPLAESTGSQATDTYGQQHGKAENPIWIKPRHQQWDNAATLTVPGRASFAFDPGREIIYVVTPDSLYTFTARGLKVSAQALTIPFLPLLPGNQSIVDPSTGTLYNYYLDQRKLAAYDTVRRRWDFLFAPDDATEYWQANSFVAKNGYLYIIGGYGQLKYKNTIQRYQLATRTWDTLPQQGDFYAPRYLSALGITPSTDTAYIIGGYGSKEGDQMLGPHHFYDLLEYDVVRNRFRKIYTLPEPPASFVFGRSMVLDKDGEHFYALINSKDRFDGQLQLIKGSLSRPAFTRLGSPFPYAFNDVRSYSDLYYCKRTNQFLAVTLFTNKDTTTEIKFYHIDIPVNEDTGPLSASASPAAGNPIGRLWPAALAVLGALGIWLLYRRRKRVAVQPVKTTEQPREEVSVPTSPSMNTAPLLPDGGEVLPAEEPAATPAPVQEETAGPSKGTIRLFGQFEVVTAGGQHFTRQFTPLLKELFLLILIDTLRYNKGVSAEKMNDILWNDKEAKDAKNNRAVNLAKLKNILEKLGGCTISRETGPWKFEYDPAVIHIDFGDYLQVFQKPGGQLSAAQADQLLRICSSGAFLEQSNYEWLDPLKAEVSNFIVEALLRFNDTLEGSGYREKSIAIANAIFQFDELNEHALRIKCKALVALGRHALAKTSYDKFAVKYKEIYGEEFAESYNSIIHA